MIAVVEPDPRCPPELVAEALDRRSLPWELVRSHAGEGPSAGATALVVMGGRQGAYEEDRDPSLGEIKQWIREFVASDRPVLGICLGAQLVADALGGRVYKANAPEVGLKRVELLADDPLAPFLGGDWLFHHQDTFELPPGAELKAVSGFPALFRVGSATAIQFHPEVTQDLLTGWLEASALVGPAGVDVAHLRSCWAEADADQTARGVALVGAWLDQEVAGAATGH